MNRQSFLLVLALLLLLVVGPLFGSVAGYLATTLDARADTTWEIVPFLVTTGVVFCVARAWMQRNGRTLADLGWCHPSSRLALILGTLVGLFWGAFGPFGYLQFVSDANVLGEGKGNILI